MHLSPPSSPGIKHQQLKLQPVPPNSQFSESTDATHISLLALLLGVDLSENNRLLDDVGGLYASDGTRRDK